MRKPKQTREVLMAVERMAGASLGRRSKEYRAGLEPLVKRSRKAKTAEGLMRAMSATLARSLPTEAVGEALGEAMTQAELIGRVAARRLEDKKQESRKEP